MMMCVCGEEVKNKNDSLGAEGAAFIGNSSPWDSG